MGRVLFDKKKELETMSTALNAVDDSNPNISTISQSNENVKPEQRAFAASHVDYDKPSLEAIGSGDGAQVHDWGNYLMKDG
jgi:hypothetical protein